MSAESVIQITDVSKSFGRNPVLDELNLNIQAGESIVIIGQSGCGKSVLLKHIIKLIEPDRGTVRFDGLDLQEVRGRHLITLRRRIGILFQSAALFDSMTVAQNVGLGLRESKEHTVDQIEDIVHEKLDLVGLADAAEKFPAELSGGMRKRVGLARAIATDPEVLLYDEPTTGLDPITADLINNLIVELSQHLKVTSIAVTHDMVSAYKIANRVVMLYEGKVRFDGTPEETRATEDATVRQFITGSARGPIKVR
ncbi:MAG: ABC transporter ATP-binding protein [bacterium]|nr:ABC transporter ATP-binding protein [bacterium]